MRRAPIWGGVIGVLLVLVVTPAIGRAGVWVALASGLGDTPTATTEFWFDIPPPRPQVLVDQITPGFTAQAGTAGGTTFFSSAATPVLLNLSDGSAYIAAGTAPDAVKVPGGTRGGIGSTTSPQNGPPVPPDAALLGIDVSTPDDAGNSVLTATITNDRGQTVGSGSIELPNGGWWVIGLGPGDNPNPGGGGGDPDPPPGGGGGDPDPPPGGGGGGTNNPTTPEPSTVVMLGLGAGFVRVWTLLHRRRKA